MPVQHLPESTYLLPVLPAAIDPPAVEVRTGSALVELGFPSPAEDFEDDSLDLNRLIVRNAPATFFYRASGNSMILAGICDGDLLAVDRSVTVQDGDTVFATWDGNAPCCKILRILGDHVELHSANPRHAAIVFPPGAEVEVFAVVGVARSLRRVRAR
ncbi:LexA family protein [Aquimonas sp.]|jgi:DNA polymerase V|uniref:LexA family protein n=1 Tax=Aquimonas sp. TaxID=1872588 RepID=UPI0037BE8F89